MFTEVVMTYIMHNYSLEILNKMEKASTAFNINIDKTNERWNERATNLPTHRPNELRRNERTNEQ